MSKWLLFLLLATGDPAPAGVVQVVDAETCHAVADNVGAGRLVTVETGDGREYPILAATCIPPCECDE
mgnify:CR=1 FL=1